MQAPDSIGGFRGLFEPDYDCGDLPLGSIRPVQNVGRGEGRRRLRRGFNAA